MSVLAKGIHREKSPFGGALDLFYRGQAQIYFRPRSSLNILSSFHVERAHTGLRKNLGRFFAASHLGELTIGMTREEEPHVELLELLLEGLSLLDSAEDAEIPALLAALELRLLGLLGFAPALTTCASCAGAIGPGSTALSPSSGGVLCGECREIDPLRMQVPAGTFQTLRHLATVAPERAGRMKVSHADARRIREFLNAFEEWQLERRLRTSRFL